MGTFLKAGNYYIDYYANGRRWREKVGKSRKLAETVLAKRKVQVAEGKFLDIKRNPKIKFPDVCQIFLENYSKVNKKSWKRDALSIRNLSKSFSGKYLYEINNLEVEEYKRKRLEGLVSVATINRELSCLKTIFRKAAEWGKIKTALPKIQLFRENNQRVRYLEEKEAQTLIEAAPEPLKFIIITALYTGMRRGEILNLKWEDVDLKEKSITIWNTKNKEKRVIPMNSMVCNTILNIDKRPDSDYIFTRHDGQDKFTDDYITHIFQGVVKKAGIKDFHFHDLRHVFASWLVMKGVDLKTVQELLGHKDFRMTLRYSHLSQDHKKQAVEFLVKDEVGRKTMDTIWTPEAKIGNSEKIENSVESRLTTV
jgi:integrase